MRRQQRGMFPLPAAQQPNSPTSQQPYTTQDQNPMQNVEREQRRRLAKIRKKKPK